MRFEIVDEWDEIIESFPYDKKDIYFYKKYVSLYQTDSKRALCAVVKDDSRVMLMPFLRDSVNDYYDFETAYGYGGPISNTDDIRWCESAYSLMHERFIEGNYICGFTRFHPLLGNERILSRSEQDTTQVLYDRNTIAIDVANGADFVWKCQLSSKNRNMIRKAEKNGLEYKAEYSFESYDHFIGLYLDTMRRISADEFYFFDREYFEKLRLQLAGNCFLGTVKKDGEIISAAIFLYSGEYGHYHLAGSDSRFSSLGANNYLLWKSACEMIELGVKQFHLGGGTTSDKEDSLYKFKKAFGNPKEFYIGKEIFADEAYRQICDDWDKANPNKIGVYGSRLQKYKY